jgi:hypothetical protein
MALRVLQDEGAAPVQFGGVKQGLEQRRRRPRGEHHVLHDLEQLVRQPAPPRLSRHLQLRRQPPTRQYPDGDLREKALGEQAADRGIPGIERSHDADRHDPRVAARSDYRCRIVDLREAAGRSRWALRKQQDGPSALHEPNQPLQCKGSLGVEDDVWHDAHQQPHQPVPQPIAGLSDRDVSRQQQPQQRAVEHGIVIGDDQHSPALQL